MSTHQVPRLRADVTELDVPGPMRDDGEPVVVEWFRLLTTTRGR